MVTTRKPEAEEHTGAMIALAPSEQDCARLAYEGDGALPCGEHHVTLYFLGEAADFSDTERDTLEAAIREALYDADARSVIAKTFGVNYWNPDSEDPAWVMAVGDTELDEGDQTLLEDTRYLANEALVRAKLKNKIPRQHSPWVPHLTLAYSSTPDAIPFALQQLGDIVFDRIRVTFGDDVRDISLAKPSGIINREIGGVAVPWKIVSDHPECSSDEPWAVVKEADGEVEGCHATEDDAKKQQAALYAAEGDSSAATTTSTSGNSNVTVTLREFDKGATPITVLKSDRDFAEGDEPVPPSENGECPPGYTLNEEMDMCLKDPDSDTESTEEDEDDLISMAGGAWEGVLVVEGVTTGDGREFAKGALEWAELPIPLRWNKEDSHGGEPHTVAVNVGRIDEVWRDKDNKDLIRAKGVFDLGGENGREAHRLMQEGFLRGVSIDADDIGEADMEMIFPEKEDTEEEMDDLGSLFAMPEKVIFHSGRIRAATLVDIPAFVEANLSLIDEPEALAASGAVAGAVAPHATAISGNNVWDSGDNEKLLGKDLLTIEEASAAYAWFDSSQVENGQIPKKFCKLIHHEVGTDGVIGPANLTACRNAIGILNGARGGTTIPAEDKTAVYTHLALHMQDAGVAPPTPKFRLVPRALSPVESSEALVAGAVGSHKTGTSTKPWSVGTHERRLPSPVPTAKAKAAYAYVDTAQAEDGNLPKSACKFLHHEIGSGGTVGSANLKACSNGIGILNGGRGGTNIPADARRGVYNHLAKHLRDGNQEVPEAKFDLGPEALVASADLLADRPPKSWFENPKLPVPIGITVTDQGRVYGHAAEWNQCHLGSPNGECVLAPEENGHPYFMTGEVVCADGSRVPVGQITIGTTHASLRLNARDATAHYENTGLVIADVAVGNDEHGIWVAGMVRPDADPHKVRALRASGQVSGDWRRIGGQLRLVGLLTVNTPGFPVPRIGARVASGVPLALVAAGHTSVARLATVAEEPKRDLRAEADEIARRIGIVRNQIKEKR